MLKNTVKLTGPGSLALLAAVTLGTPEARAKFFGDPAGNLPDLLAAAAGIFVFFTIVVIYFTWSAQGAQALLEPAKVVVEKKADVAPRKYSVVPTMAQLLTFAAVLAVVAGLLTLVLPTLYAAMLGVGAATAVAFKTEGANLTVGGIALFLMAALVQEEFFPSSRDCDRVAWQLDWLADRQAKTLRYWEICSEALNEEDFCYDQKPERTPEEIQLERRRLWWRLVDRCGSSRGIPMPA